MPEPVGAPMARWAARGVGLAFMRSWVRQVERNLRRVYGPGFGGAALRRAVAATFDSYGRYFYELFRLPGTSKRWIDEHIDIIGAEHIAVAIAAGAGVVLALPHLGNWDFAGAWLAGQGYTVTVVAEPVEPPELFEWFVETRRRLGMRVIALSPSAGGRGARARCRRTKRVPALRPRPHRRRCRGRVLRRAHDPARRSGDARAADRRGAAAGRLLLPPRRPPHRHRSLAADRHAPRSGRLRDDIARVTQDLADRFEDLIRAAPEQWHLLQPNWPSDREASTALDRFGCETAGMGGRRQVRVMVSPVLDVAVRRRAGPGAGARPRAAAPRRRRRASSRRATARRPSPGSRRSARAAVWEQRLDRADRARPAVARRTIEALRSFEPDVVHLHEPLAPGPTTPRSSVPRSRWSARSTPLGRAAIRWYQTFRPALRPMMRRLDDPRPRCRRRRARQVDADVRRRLRDRCRTASRSTASPGAEPTPTRRPAVAVRRAARAAEGPRRCCSTRGPGSTATPCCGWSATDPQTASAAALADVPDVEWLGRDHRRREGARGCAARRSFCAPVARRRVVRGRAARGDGGGHRGGRVGHRRLPQRRPRRRGRAPRPAGRRRRAARRAAQRCSTTTGRRGTLVGAGRAARRRVLDGAARRAATSRSTSAPSPRSAPVTSGALRRPSSELALEVARPTCATRSRRCSAGRAPAARSASRRAATSRWRSTRSPSTSSSSVLRAAGDIAFYSEDRGYVEFGTPRAILVVDPIDGTRPAAAGLESCCVSVAVVPPSRGRDARRRQLRRRARDQVRAAASSRPGRGRARRARRRPPSRSRSRPTSTSARCSGPPGCAAARRCR